LPSPIAYLAQHGDVIRGEGRLRRLPDIIFITQPGRLRLA
jgi:hypothetical protein